jgi:16S rRNA (cytidine1402-2'-O)-methyltransferase
MLTALLDALAPQTRLCVATDLSLSGETVTTLTVSAWRKKEAPDFDRRPTVFLLLA